MMDPIEFSVDGELVPEPILDRPPSQGLAMIRRLALVFEALVRVQAHHDLGPGERSRPTGKSRRGRRLHRERGVDPIDLMHASAPGTPDLKGQGGPAFDPARPTDPQPPDEDRDGRRDGVNREHGGSPRRR